MALDKNDGTFSSSIEGVISGKTSQVDGMNGLLNDLIGNDNYLKDKKLDRGNYVGSGELLRKDDNGIWGGEYGGEIQDPIPKELNKRYIDNINGKAFICIKAGDSSVVSNTIEYFTPCNVADNLDKLQNLDKREYWGEYGEAIIKHYPGGTKELTIPARTLNGEITLSLSQYFTEINAVSATTNTIYSNVTGSVNVVETQIISNTDIKIKLTVLLDGGAMQKPSGANRVSVIVTGR